MRVHPDQFTAGSLFHAYNHSLDGRMLFYDDADYRKYLQLLKKRLSQEFSVFAYCLMPNHYHFLVRQNGAEPIYSMFEQPHKSYARYYNLRYGAKGKILRDKMNHKSVLENEYIVNLCAYIHANPMSAGLVGHVEEWQYSNLPEFLGTRHGTLCSREFIGNSVPDRDKYRMFVLETALAKNSAKLGKL
ncbi:MAG: transposase [Candidatus Cloacimonadaceae bacterium]|nr:transposase [Candidatus Cloacimonadaceae bacterium]MDP3114017.1 transposase [Candidatus Cloacimonadaceae bacterium]